MKWWDVGRLGNYCVGAWQPAGSPSLRASLQNLARTNRPLLTGTLPTWDIAKGWTFNGSSQYLDTGLLASAHNWTLAIQISGASGTQAAAGYYHSGTLRLAIYPSNGSSTVWYNDGYYLFAGGPTTAGNLAFSNNSAYKDGIDAGSETSGSRSGTVTRTITLGGLNGGTIGYWAGSISAAAIYSCELPPLLMQQLAWRMANAAQPSISAWNYATPRPVVWWIPPGGAQTYYQTLAAEIEPLTEPNGATPNAPIKHTARTLAAALTPAAALSYLKAFFRTLTAGLTPTAYLDRRTGRTLTAEIEPLTEPNGATPNAPIKHTARTLAAALTPAAALSYLKAFFRTLTAGLTPTGNLVRRPLKSLTAAVAPAANLVKRTSRTLAATLAPAAALSTLRAFLRTLTASLTPTATLSTLRAFVRTLTAGLTPDGSLVRRTERTLLAGLMPVGSVIRFLVGALSGRARCTLTIDAATVAGLSMVNATRCRLEMSEV